MTILHLPIKRKWFDMIKRGEKTEEYRDITDYYVRRLIDSKNDMESLHMEEMLNDLRAPYNRHNAVRDLMLYYDISFKQIDIVHFVNGYGKHRPDFSVECKGVTIRKGRTGWGAILNELYFVIQLGEIIAENVRKR